MAGLLLSASVTLNLFGESRPKYGKPYYPLEDTCAQSIANNQSFIATRICTSLFSLSKTTKAPHPLEKKNANLSWCPGCFSNSKTRSSLLMAAACESAVSVFTDQAWETAMFKRWHVPCNMSILSLSYLEAWRVCSLHCTCILIDMGIQSYDWSFSRDHQPC